MREPPKRFYELDARDPLGGVGRTLYLDPEKLKELGVRGPKFKLWNAALIPEVVRARNTRLFRGLKREGMEDAHCYAGFPTHRFTDGNNQVPALGGSVFMVFVTPRWIICDWRWELPSAEGVDLEKFFADRFDDEIKT